jgi:vancomycin resistance protein YoaR
MRAFCSARPEPAVPGTRTGFGSLPRMGSPPAGAPGIVTRGQRARARAARGARAHLVDNRLRLALAAASAVVLVLLFAAVFERVAYSGKVMPGVTLAGSDVPVAGEGEGAARRAIRALGADLEGAPIRARAGRTELMADPGNLALQVDELATLQDVRAAGRSRNPLEQVASTVLRRLRDESVELRTTYDAAALQGVLDAWSRQTGEGIVEGDLQFVGARVVPVEPRAGTGILPDDARRRVEERLRTADRSVIELPIGRVEPKVSAEEVDDAARRARTMLSSAFVIRANGGRVTLTPEQVAATLVTSVGDDALDVRVDRDRLRFVMAEQVAQFAVAPVDARFEVTATGAVNVVPSQAGRAIDVGAVARAIENGRHRIDAPLREVQPERDTRWARRLGIKERVSEFTTSHAPGQPRVVNIHRAADLIDDIVVEPGQVFSLNEAIGPRTAERGFVSAPVFYGEFTEDFGGGVSQLATTVFNAIFFGGYETITHKPHSIYISRYPMGRESTINYGTVDVQFRNDSKHGVLIRTSYTDSSITVAFYGDKEGKTVTAEGPNVLATRPPTTELIEWPLLPVGKQEMVEEGYTGYDVENFRIIERPGQEPVRQRFFWRYRMIPNKVLVGTAPPPTTTTPPTTAPKGRPPRTSTTTTPRPPPASQP